MTREEIIHELEKYGFEYDEDYYTFNSSKAGVKGLRFYIPSRVITFRYYLVTLSLINNRITFRYDLFDLPAVRYLIKNLTSEKFIKHITELIDKYNNLEISILQNTIKDIDI